MGYSKEQLFARLQELQIEFSKYEHPVVLTVEAQAKYVGDMGGGPSKNVFLKDKKHGFYIVSALADTRVDLKALSRRLGLGKGGLRMAPEEALGEILQVPLGCVTPFALVNESARDVSLLLDQEFKAQKYCFFHPLSNDMSISLNAHGLDKFLKSIGRDPSYVDLEANPTVRKDQPPDLAALVPSSRIFLPEQLEKQPSQQVPTDKSHVSADSKLRVGSGQGVKSSVGDKNTKGIALDMVQWPKLYNYSQLTKPVHIAQMPTSKPILYNYAQLTEPVNVVQSTKPVHIAPMPTSIPVSLVQLLGPFANVEQFVEEILHKTSELLLSEINEETIKQHGERLGTVVSDNLRNGLTADLNDLAMKFKSTAYMEGFYASTGYTIYDSKS